MLSSATLSFYEAFFEKTLKIFFGLLILIGSNLLIFFFFFCIDLKILQLLFTIKQKYAAEKILFECHNMHLLRIKSKVYTNMFSND